MALSEDASVLATGSDDGSVYLWTTATDSCKCLGRLVGHSKYITCLAIEEGFVISSSADQTIKKWHMGTGECLFTYEGHSGMVNRVICTSEFVFSSSYDCTARGWLLQPELGVAPCMRVFRGHRKGVYPMVFIPSAADDDCQWDEEATELSDLLITGSGDATARVWSVESGQCRAQLSGHSGPVHSLAVDPLGKLLFTGSADGSVRTWDILKGDTLKQFDGHSQPITAIQVRPFT